MSGTHWEPTTLSSLSDSLSVFSELGLSMVYWEEHWDLERLTALGHPTGRSGIQAPVWEILSFYRPVFSELCWLLRVKPQTLGKGMGRGGKVAKRMREKMNEQRTLLWDKSRFISYYFPYTEPLRSSASFFVVIWAIWSCCEECVRRSIWGPWLSKWKVLIKTASVVNFGLMNRMSL